MCSHCHHEKNGDGFAAIMWMKGVEFPAAVELVANHLGLAGTTKKKSAAKKEKADPAKDLEWMPWAPLLAAHFCDAKKGVTQESLLAQGCKMARYKTLTVIVWPVIGPDLDTEKPVGYVIMDYKARTNIPRYDHNKQFVENIDKKVMFGSSPGIIGFDAINKLKTAGLTQMVWKCEGLTDQAALWAAIPENVRKSQAILTLANGAGENPKWQGDMLSNFNVNILHDCDEPGQAGAKKWSEFIAKRMADGKRVKNIILPYTIEEKKGKDIRDWLGEGNKYGDLLNLVDSTAATVVERHADGSLVEEEESFPVHELLMDKLKLRIIEVKESGAIRLFSMLLRKPSTVAQISRLKHEDMIRICGAPAMTVISEAPDHEETWGMADVRKAIAYACSRHNSNRELHGVGVWQGVDELGNETETIVLVNNTQAVRRNGDKILRPVLEPCVDGLSLNFGAGDKDWFDPELLDRNLKNAEELEWRKAVIDQTVDLFSRWRWRNQEADPTLMVGLVLATWIQTLWKWRPLVSIVGESNSGKSMFFQLLGGSDHARGLFGHLAFKQSKSTAAGIRQFVDQTGKAILCDEFEHSKARVEILEMMRASTRGDMIARGTAGEQRGKSFALRHICFTAAIEGGLQRQPDMNRFIQFDLLKPDREMHGKLLLPGGRELYELGQKLLAISVSLAIPAKKLAVRMADTKSDVDARRVESYAVPAAILGLAFGFDEVKCRKLLKDLAELTIDKDAQGESDQVELLEAILSSTINCGHPHGMLSVAQIIEDFRSSRYLDNHGKLEAAGIRLFDEVGLFINSKLVSRVLLRGSPWEGQSVDQILKRLPGVKSAAKKLAGRSLRGVMVPYEYIKPAEMDKEELATQQQAFI